ncbi:unnamed protein product [Thlaspi arvense]|uniref:Uncharacterized protein n=1 Tax=Thlaspi arvense TaxID=13288 RepID=A0AAU9SKN3_THLAR|nr:unnamed protein product [Thlaspi arvense]
MSLATAAYVVFQVGVFSAFGFVHKITTFEKTAGFQALVQFSDLKLPLLQKIPLMEEAFRGDVDLILWLGM